MNQLEITKTEAPLNFCSYCEKEMDETEFVDTGVCMTCAHYIVSERMGKDGIKLK